MTEENQAVEAVDPGAQAESPTATETQGVTDERSMFDVVEAALKPSEEASPAAESTGDDKPEPSAQGEAHSDEADELTNDELSKVAEKTRNRIQSLLQQKTEATKVVEELRPKAETLDKITGYLNEHSLKPEEFDTALGLMAQMRTDPRAALDRLVPIVEDLMKRAGALLPEDLADDVRQGRITQDRALELSQARARADNVEKNSTEQQQRQESQRRQQEFSQFSGSVTNAISQWEQKQAASDPDWNLKRDRIGELVELEFRRGNAPKSVQEAVGLAEQLRTRVNQEFARLKPAPKPVDRGPRPSSSPGSAPKPSSMKDIIEQALGNR